MSRKIVTVLIALMLVSGVVACGSDGSDESVDASSASDGSSASESSDESSPQEADTEGDATSEDGDTGTAGDRADSNEAVESTDGPEAAGAIVVETPNGPVEVPANAERVTVLDEYAAMNLLAVGVVPTVVYGAYGSIASQQILEGEGVEIRSQDGFTTPNIEDVAATDPDLIIYSTEGGFADIYDPLSEIAPTVELPYNVPWREAITEAAAVVGRQDVAADLITKLEGELDIVAGKVGDQDLSVSILADTYGMLFAASMESPLSGVIAEAGLNRPDPQLDGEADSIFAAAIMLSPELVPEHDGDIVVVLSGIYYNDTAVTDLPTFQELPAVADGRSVIADGDLWFGTFPFAIYWLLQDLEALVDGEGQAGVGGADDYSPRWDEFQAFVAGDAPAAGDGGGDDGASVEGCREIEHLVGTTCVPIDAERILAYDPLTVLPTLIALDVPVAGTVSPYSYGPEFVSYLDPADTEGIEVIAGFDATVNLELVAAFQPDLIIGSVSRIGEFYDEMSQIAPTVVTGYAFYEVDWRKEILLTAEAVGKVPEAEDLLADLDDHITSTNEVLGGLDLTLTRADVWQGTPLYYRFDCIWIGELVSGAGLSQPASQTADACEQQDPSTAIGYPSLEELDVLDADAIVIYQQQASDADVGADPTPALAESPLWPTLEAVQADQVYVMGDAWGLGGSVQAAHTILDDLVDVVFADAAQS